MRKSLLFNGRVVREEVTAFKDRILDAFPEAESAEFQWPRDVEKLGQ